MEATVYQSMRRKQMLGLEVPPNFQTMAVRREPAKHTIARPPPAPRPPNLFHTMQHLPLNPPHHCTKAHPLRSRVEEAPTLPPADRAAGRTSRGREAMEGRIERAPPPQLIHPDREFTTPLRSTPKLAAATRRMGEAAVEPPKQALRHPLAPR